MKKWSYRIESLHAKDFNEASSLKEIKDFISQIGLEGWELIGITPTSQVEKIEFGGKKNNLNKCLLFFKKEIE